ncbi:MAG: AN1-type zinc finger protein [Amphiamblys sp. WSBS2006]|nr:MAG: AN1-type zinc finger protein [Amphiamblys sp. WSBS2006]
MTAGDGVQKEKGLCSEAKCVKRVAKIIGQCRYCGCCFCSSHRLPESHSCTDLETCRAESFDKNTDRRMEEKCVAKKT